MNSKGALLEDLKVDVAINANSTSSALYSQSFSMAGYHRAAVLINVGEISATGDQVNVSILGGNSTVAVSSMSSISNATLAVGTSSTKGTVNGAASAKINVLGSAITSAIRTVTLNGVTLQGGTNATYATAAGGTAVVGFTGAGAASVVAKSLTTVIKANFTAITATYSGTGSTACAVTLTLTDPGATVINVATTAQSTAGGLGVQALRSLGIISFAAGDLASTASSFSNFGVLVSCTGSSAIPVNVTIFRDPGYVPDFQGVLHKKDLSTSAAI